MSEKKTEQVKQTRSGGITTVIVVVVLAVILIFSFIMVINAQKLGEDTAEFMAGKLGAAVGNLEAAAECIAEAPAEFDKAKEEGLSAKDTTVEIMQNILAESGGQKLEVLSANLGITNFHKSTDAYSVLYVAKATAIFTVDMNKAVITADNNKITVVLPEPECKMNYDDTSTQKLAERSRLLFDGETIDGYNAYLNSVREIEKNSEEELEKRPYLRESARAAAEKAVGRLVRSVCGNKYTYEIKFDK